MFKKIALSLILVIFSIVVYYLFLRPADYIISFKTVGTPGAIEQTIKLWSKNSYAADFKNSSELYHFQNQFTFNDSLHDYSWEIKPINDSISKVRVLTTDVNNSLRNRIEVLFTENHFEKRAKKTIADLINVLKLHQERYKVVINGPVIVPEKYVVYVPVKCAQHKKAFLMMNNYQLLNEYIAENEIETDGPPMIEITNWDRAQDSISFNFCYPIKRVKQLSASDNLNFKKLSGRRALKATYNGNYITSDRSWYKLMQSAQNKSLKTDGWILEIFYDNPNMGGDEMKWTAETFLGLAD